MHDIVCEVGVGSEIAQLDQDAGFGYAAEATNG